MSTLYEDNYGFYDVDEPDEEEFFKWIISQSRVKTCRRCHRKVKLQKHVMICACCTQAVEMGASKKMEK